MCAGRAMVFGVRGLCKLENHVFNLEYSSSALSNVSFEPLVKAI